MKPINMNGKILAQITNPVLPETLGSGGTSDGGTIIGNLIGSIMGAMLIFAFILSLFYLITGGFSWITGGNDKGKLEMARNKITNAMLDYLGSTAAWSIMTLIGEFFGIDFPELKVPTITQTSEGDSSNQQPSDYRNLPIE